MSSQPAEADPEIDQDDDHDGEHSDHEGASPGLTIALPDGSASVSDAIVKNREMLREPQDHGLATEEDITHLSEAMEGLSGNVEAVSHQCDETNSTVADLQDDVEAVSERCDETDATVAQLQEVVDQQRRQIEELQSMVTSLADILGTEAEWQTFEDA